MNSIKKYIITLSALTFVLVGCKGKDAKDSATVAPSTIEEIQKEKGKPARVAKAKKSSLKDIREFSGTIEGMQQANAISKMGDPLAKIYVQVGSTVQKDQVLAEYIFTGDNTQYEQVQEQVALLESVFQHVSMFPCDPDSLTEPDNVIVVATKFFG